MIDLELVCDVCGNYLDFTVEYMNNNLCIIVEPCETCLSDRYDEGHDAGYDEGKEERE